MMNRRLSRLASALASLLGVLRPCSSAAVASAPWSALALTRGPCMVLFLVQFIGVFSAKTASAATPASGRLVYELGPGTEVCPGERELAADVAARLGYDPFRGDARRRIEVRIVSDEQGLHATVQLFDEKQTLQGGRELSSQQQDCRELSSAVAFAISVALDPMAALRPSPSASASSVTPAAPPPPPPRPPAAPAEKSSPMRAHVAVGAHLAFGAAPSMAPGLVLQSGLQWPRASLSLEGRVDRAASREVSGGKVESSLQLGSLIPCVRIGRVWACGNLSVGGLRGSGAGVDIPRTETSFYAAVGPRLSLDLWERGDLLLRPWAEALMPLTRTRLAINGVEAWRTPSVGVSAGLGLAFRFL